MILGTGEQGRCVASVIKPLNITLVVFALLCLCASSWGGCYKTYTGSYSCPSKDNVSITTSFCSGTFSFSCLWSSNGTMGSGTFRGTGSGKVCYGIDNTWCCEQPHVLYCDTQAEADSVAHEQLCQNNPSDPSCLVTSDTLIFACSESIVNGQAVATIYRLSCKATNGELTECNGKQNIDIATDGQPVKQMSGTCAQNGLPNGPFGGATPQDSTQLPNGANADCFAITGSKCHMKDKVSGNTFTCDCDGSCQVAIQNLMAGSANCTNPYPQPTSSSDSLNIGGSSGSGGGSSASSSGSEGESSPSSSPSDSSGDFEYDYTALLEAIQANTQYTGEQASNLNNKADVANEYLRQIADKDWNPTINVGSPNVNVTLNADTAKAPAQILGLLNDKLSGGEPNPSDTAGTGSRLDGYLSSIDSIVAEGTPDMSDSIGNAVQGVNNAYNALKDSLGNSAWSDSVNKWQGQLTNNGTLSGSGSDNCPAVLTRKWNVPLGAVTAEVGPLGKYLCEPIFGGVTGWALARILLRTLVSIFCMIWLFKAVMGIDGGNIDED